MFVVKKFLCPSCKKVFDYWEYTSNAVEYGKVNLNAEHEADYLDYYDTYYSCPSCGTEIYYNDVILTITVDDDNKKVNIETSSEHEGFDDDELIEIVKEILDDIDDDYKFVINGFEAGNTSEFEVFDDENESVREENEKTTLEDILF